MDDVFARSEKRHRAFVAVVIAAVAVVTKYAAVSVATRAPVVTFTTVGASVEDPRPGCPLHSRSCRQVDARPEGDLS